MSRSLLALPSPSRSAEANCRDERVPAMDEAEWAEMPVNGPHCLRHSYALHLLRKGVPLKVLGDLLGHKNAEGTSVYVRLSIDDLRDVALDLPNTPGLIRKQEGSL